jgi:hypothetical protein
MSNPQFLIADKTGFRPSFGKYRVSSLHPYSFLSSIFDAGRLLS